MRRILIATFATAALMSFATAQTVTTTETEVFVTAQTAILICTQLIVVAGLISTGQFLREDQELRPFCLLL
ncbi:hypothetical protein ACI0FM_14195 [Paenochrobactrum sp. BZR 588]|uniref:hypothetical protein n=1 Tax=Paenochrobactrum TaxID=999488 RepID=UPI0035BBC388